MRNTPQNKVRRIEQALLKCEMALLMLDARLESDDTEEDAVLSLQQRRNGLASHIERLKKTRYDWQKGGPRARR